MRLPWVKINATKRPITEGGAHYIIAFVGQKPQSVMAVHSLLQIEKKRLRSAPKWRHGNVQLKSRRAHRLAAECRGLDRKSVV